MHKCTYVFVLAFSISIQKSKLLISIYEIIAMKKHSIPMKPYIKGQYCMINTYNTTVYFLVVIIYVVQVVIINSLGDVVITQYSTYVYMYGDLRLCKSVLNWI